MLSRAPDACCMSATIFPPGPMMQLPSLSDTSTLSATSAAPGCDGAGPASSPRDSAPASRCPCAPSARPWASTPVKAATARLFWRSAVAGALPAPLPLPENSNASPGISFPAYEVAAHPANHGSAACAPTCAAMAGSAACTPDIGPLRATTCSAKSPPVGGIVVFSTWMKSPAWARRARMFSPPLPMSEVATAWGTTSFTRAPPGSTPSSPLLTEPSSSSTRRKQAATAATTCSTPAARTFSSWSWVPG
mmetsp:Transcript_76634/g.216834  ORF Transcript_76634/g.216834 Transcript_76634/m.216834 type:complete len:249 (-) Transcript_76634:577-1323(-)